MKGYKKSHDYKSGWDATGLPMPLVTIFLNARGHNDSKRDGQNENK